MFIALNIKIIFTRILSVKKVISLEISIIAYGIEMRQQFFELIESVLKKEFVYLKTYYLLIELPDEFINVILLLENSHCSQ
jgi:hypothetical protein